MSERKPPIERFHPAEFIRDEMMARYLSVSKLAKLMDIDIKILTEVLDEKEPITHNIALKLGQVFGTSVRLWINLQRAFDEKGDA